MKPTLYKITLSILLRMPNWFFAALFVVAFPIYKALHKNRAYGRTVKHLKYFIEYSKQSNISPQGLADKVFNGIYWNAIDSYRGLARLSRTTKKIVYENENIIQEALANSIDKDGTPLPIAAISIHQGAFELLHRSLCRYSDNVHLITDSVGDKAARTLLKDLRSDPNLTEYHPDELPKLLRNLFTPPQDLNRQKNAILAMVVDQGRNTKGTPVTLFNKASILYLRLPQKLNQKGAGIVTFRTFTRNNQIVIRFEKFYPQKYGNTLTKDITQEIENWISENPEQWSWNYHGNFRVK